MRPIAAAAASLLIATAFACSPSDGPGGAASVGTPDSGSPDAGTPDAGPDGGGTVTPPDDGGLPGSGGTPDGGGGSGGGGGGGTPDGGGGSGGGGGSDGGTVATDCDGIVPASLGDSFSATVTPGNSATCSFAVSDFSGNVALESHQSLTRLDWFTFSSSGSPLGRIQSTRTLIPGDVGFEGAAVWNGAGSPMDMWHVWAWGPDGSVKSSSPVGSDACFTPTTWFCSSGGAVVLTTCGSGDGALLLYRVDANANVLWSVGLGNAGVSQAAAGDANGNILVIDNPPFPGPKNLVGRWIDGSGKFTDWFNIPGTTGTVPFIVHSLIGGGAAVMEDEVWRSVVPSGGLPQAAPDWLASRTGTNIAIVRGRRAYAFTSRTGASKVELVSPAGNSCGSIDVGGANVIVGGDGTVFTQTGDSGCRRTWYPALLR